MEENMYEYLRMLSDKHGINHVQIELQLENVSHWPTDYGVCYARLNDMGVVFGRPFVYIFLASSAPEDWRKILAHEFCHVLQMYHWHTWPEGLEHPAPAHPLEIEANEFAANEVASSIAS